MRDTFPLITADQYHLLGESGVLDRIELIDGRVVVGHDRRNGRDFELCFSPAQAREAARHGVRVWSALDAVLEDPLALADLRARLDRGEGQLQDR
jgi:hypothetical protein